MSLQDFNEAVHNFSRAVVPEEAKRFQRWLTLEALRRIVLRTPVDTGRTRGNWQVGLNEIPSTEKESRQPIKDGLSVLARMAPFGATYVSNPLDHVEVLEFGLFSPRDPGPSKDPRRGRKNRILVKDGFSVQSPQGMVGITFQELLTIIPGEIAA